MLPATFVQSKSVLWRFEPGNIVPATFGQSELVFLLLLLWRVVLETFVQSKFVHWGPVQWIMAPATFVQTKRRSTCALPWAPPVFWGLPGTADRQSTGALIGSRTRRWRMVPATFVQSRLVLDASCSPALCRRTTCS